MGRIRSTGPVFHDVAWYAAMLLLVTACATSGSQRLTLDTRDVPAVEYLPDEVTAMMDDLGYAVMPESDAQRLVQSFDDYTLHFKARDDANIRVDVHFRLVDKLTAMHLYNTTEKSPGAATRQRYKALKQRVQQEFGADNVRF